VSYLRDIYARIWNGSTTVGVSSAGALSVHTKSAQTASAPTFATVGVATGEVLAANANRKGAAFVNLSENRISFAFAANNAVLDRGITLYPAGVFEMDEYTFTTAAVNCIASVAGSVLSIQEYT